MLDRREFLKVGLMASIAAAVPAFALANPFERDTLYDLEGPINSGDEDHLDTEMEDHVADGCRYSLDEAKETWVQKFWQMENGSSVNFTGGGAAGGEMSGAMVFEGKNTVEFNVGAINRSDYPWRSE